MSDGQRNLFAILIGVDYYFPNQLPGGVDYGHLHGCVRDVGQMALFLRTRLGLPAENVISLTASHRQGDAPAEPSSSWPTYANMVAAFRQVAEKAQPGDQVLVHYSGHGGRVASIYPDDVKPGNYDEALVPTDIGMEAGRYLRDLELAHLLHTLAEQQLLITVLLDCCHSGGMTRGDAVVRGSDQIDRATRPVDTLAAKDAATLLATWQTLTAGTRAGTALTSGGLPASGDWVVLTACRPHELAYEFPFDGLNRSGALSYWLLDALHAGGLALSYEQLHRRLVARIQSQFRKQRPQLYGDGDRAVLGRERIAAQFAVPIITFDRERNELLLNAGSVHGVLGGAQFAIFPPNVADLRDLSSAIARVTVTRADAAESRARIDELKEGASIAPGAQAVLLNPVSTRLRAGVRLQTVGEGALPPEAQQALREAHAAAQFGQFIELDDKGDGADFIVAARDGCYEIWDAGGEVIPRITPHLTLPAAEAAAGVVERLIHLTRFRNVQQLANSDPRAENAPTITLKWLGVPAGHTFAPGDEPVLLVRNDAEEEVEMTLLELAPDWRISQIYPDGAAESYTFAPGESDELTFEVFLKAGRQEETSIYKLFATRKASNFRMLELPSLDSPFTRGTRSADQLNELELLLQQAVEVAPSTRGGRLSTAAGRDWTTAQLELHVARPAPAG